MNHKILPLTFILIFVIAFKPLIAKAQNCQAQPISIFDMSDPDIGAYTLWDYVQGDHPQEESFKSGFYNGKEMLYAGEKRDEDRSDETALILAKLDYRGRAVWKKEHRLSGDLIVHNLLPHPKGMALLATRRIKTGEHYAWFAVFDTKTGAQIFEAKLTQSKDNASAASMVKRGNAYYVATNQGAASTLYKIDAEAKIQQKRSYSSSGSNKAQSLLVTPDRIYVAGSASTPNGSAAGWIAALDQDLRLLWENILPRGVALSFNDIALADDQTVLVSGTSQPLGGEPSAGALMGLHAQSGALLWERYYRSHKDTSQRPYEGGALLRNYDRASVSFVLNAGADPRQNHVKPKDPRYMTYAPFARLVTVNARGQSIFYEDYKNALAIKVADLITAQNENRVLLGETQSADPYLLDEAKKKGYKIAVDAFVSQNAWAIGVPVSKPYKDPC